MFWPHDDTMALMGWLKEPVNTLQNLLLLGTHVHGKFGRKEFFLRPLLDRCTQEELLLQFSWVRPASTILNGVEFNQRANETGLGNMRVPAPYPDIESGDIVRIMTCDPKRFPLPNPELLNIQVALQIAINAAAAADVLELLFKEDYSEPPIGALRQEIDSLDPELIYTERPPDPCPNFSNYLIRRAVSLGIVKWTDIPKWQRILIRNEAEDKASSAGTSVGG